MQTNSQSLAGKVALVSGASGWIGAAIARNLAAAGAKVIVNYKRSDEAAKKTVASIEAAAARRMPSRPTSPTRPRYTLWSSRRRRSPGRVQILVNNALNSSVHGVPIEEQTWQKHYLGHLDFCVKAPLFLLKATLAHMKASQDSDAS